MQSSKLEKLTNNAVAVVRVNVGTRVNGKVASIRTQEQTEQVIKETCNRLHKLGYYLEDINGLQGKHIQALVRDWHAQGLANKTMQNQYSRLRILCSWIGKGDLIGKNDISSHLPEVDPKSLKVKTYTETSKSWSGNGIDVIEKIDAALLNDPRHGNMLRLALAFGLRKKEQLKIKLWESDKGNYLSIDGNVAKNGRYRAIPIETNTPYGQFQRWCLDEAKKVVKKRETLGWPELQYKQSENRYYHYMRILGATKADMGAVGHGLRSEFAENQALMLGLLPPSLGGASHQMPK